MSHCKDVWGIGVMNGIKDVGLLNSSRIGKERRGDGKREEERREEEFDFLVK